MTLTCRPFVEYPPNSFTCALWIVVCSDEKRTSLYGIALALLDLLQRAGGAVQSVSVVAAELGVGALQRGVAVRLRLLDAVVVSRLASALRRRVGSRGCVLVPVRLARLVVLRRVLRLCKIVSTGQGRRGNKKDDILAIVEDFGSD